MRVSARAVATVAAAAAAAVDKPLFFLPLDETFIKKLDWRADDTRSVADDLRMSKQRCSNQRTQIGLLEKRVDELLASQRLSAEQFAVYKLKIFL